MMVVFVVQLLICVLLCDPVSESLSFTLSQSFLKFMSIELGCYLTISASATRFFFCLQYFPMSQLFATLWTVARQASLSFIISLSLPKLMSIESVIPSNHLILCRPLLLLPSVLPSIRVFSNESALHIRWPKYWSFSFSTSPSNEYSGLTSFRIGCFHLLAV